MSNPLLFFESLGAHLLLIQSLIPVSAVYFNFNESSWFISTLMFLYLVTPIAVGFIKRMHQKSVIVIIELIIIQFILGFSLQNQDFINWFVYISPFYRILEYVIGIYICKIFLDQKLNLNKITCTSIELIMIVLIIFLNNSILIPNYLQQSIIYTPFISILIFFLANQCSYISDILSSRILIKVSQFSMEFFLIHMPIIITISKLFDILNLEGSFFNLLRILVCLIITCTSAICLNKFISNRTMNFTIGKGRNLNLKNTYYCNVI